MHIVWDDERVSFLGRASSVVVTISFPLIVVDLMGMFEAC